MSATNPARPSCRAAPRATARAALRMRGLSLVELLIGVAIGLVLAAATATFLAGSLRDNRSLLLESRLMQDLRTAADVVARDLRRAGYWADAAAGVWSPGASGVATNPYLALAPATAASDAASFAYSRDAVENGAVDGNEQFGFRLRNGVIEMQLGAANWQALTDSTSLTVTAFAVTPSRQSVALGELCPVACPAGSPACPPRLEVRTFAVRITGRAAADAAVTRTVRSQVRLRSDPVIGSCAT
jgi:prepilin peptidase dependent protein B